jgi:LysR family transcriptional regulator, hydrogen peroxide-inducible genes activator
VTQSSLSASLKELEGILRATLVDRTRRRVVLTPLGLATVERARRLLQEAEALVEAAGAESEPLTGTLRLGVIPTIGPFLLPRVLPRLRRAHPRLRLYLVEDMTDRLVEQLHQGKLDVLLLALPYDCGNAEMTALFEDRFMVALPRRHPLAGAGRIAPRQLSSQGLLLLKEGHCLREHALSACRMAGRGPAAKGQREAVEATSLHTLVQMVENGLGVTLLPELAIAGGILRGTRLATVPLAGPAASRQIGLAWRRGTARAAEFELLAEELRALAPAGGGAGPRETAD